MIDDSNQEFEWAPAERKRVMIAQDIIARIDLASLRATTGLIGNINSDFDRQEPAKDFLNGDTISCSVCAKGAIFCSYIGRVNKMSLGELDDIMNGATGTMHDNFHEKLSEIFEEEQIDLIEIAFEGYSILELAAYDDSERAEEFYEQHRGDEFSPNERLKAICENIIANNGTFIP